MPLVTDKAIFLHLPKTGGTWIRTALKRAGVCGREEGDYNGSEFPEELREGRNVFTFVRAVPSWYFSYWAFKQQANCWGVRRPTTGQHRNLFDADCRSNDYSEFLRRAIEEWPAHYGNQYVKRFTVDADYIGTYENLQTDLIAILQAIGEPFDREALIDTPPTRVAGQLQEFARHADVTQSGLRSLLRSERWAACFHANLLADHPRRC